MKTTLMLVGLTAVLGGGLACAKIFSSSSPKTGNPAAIEASCDGLTGQAKVDCEKRNQP